MALERARDDALKPRMSYLEMRLAAMQVPTARVARGVFKNAEAQQELVHVYLEPGFTQERHDKVEHRGGRALPRRAVGGNQFVDHLRNGRRFGELRDGQD